MSSLSYPSYTQYCAEFHASSSGGMTGYFGMSITPSTGTATYAFDMDTSSFDWDGCDYTQGLSYHIHSYWTDASVTSGYTSSCGSSYTGGHYDPFFACGSASQNSDDCTAMNQLVAGERYSYTYICNSTAYSSGQFSACEVGDLSGKFGIANVVDNNTLTSSGPWSDPIGPTTYSYAQASASSNQWQSIVFHCGDGTRLFCAGKMK